jgi:hypothetical protein
LFLWVVGGSFNLLAAGGSPSLAGIDKLLLLVPFYLLWLPLLRTLLITSSSGNRYRQMLNGLMWSRAAGAGLISVVQLLAVLQGVMGVLVIS